MRWRRPIFVVSVLAAALAAPGTPESPAERALRQYLSRAGFDWQSSRTEHFNIYFERDSHAQRHLASIESNIEMDRAHVLSLLRASDYQPTIYAFFVSSGAQMKELLGVHVNGRSRPAQHAVFSVSTPERMHLTHEICHEIASNLWGAAEPWIEEGLAVYADEGRNTYYDSWRLLESGSLISLEKLVDASWKSSMYSPDITYSELGAFVKFLNDHYGVDRLRLVWQGGSRSIPEVYGKSLAELERDWRASLVSQFPEKPTRHYRPGDSGFWIE